MSDKKTTGYQYTVTIDQAAAEQMELPGDIGARHLAIVAMCEKYFAWKGSDRMTLEGQTYYLVQWETVRDRLPRFFGGKSRATIKRYILRLIEVGILEPYPNNQQLGQSWFRFGDLYAEMQNFKPSQKWTPRLKNETPPSQKRDGTRLKNETPPVSKMRRYNELTNYELTDEDNGEGNPSPSEWKKQLLEDAAFKELVGMKYTLLPSEIAPLLDEFILQKKGLGKTNNDYPDFKNNFFYWLGKRPATNQSANGTGKTQHNANLINERQARNVLAQLNREAGS